MGRHGVLHCIFATFSCIGEEDLSQHLGHAKSGEVINNLTHVIIGPDDLFVGSTPISQLSLAFVKVRHRILGQSIG